MKSESTNIGTIMKDGWHALTVEDTLKRLTTTLDGVPTAEVAERRMKHGTNALPRRVRVSTIAMVLNQFRSPLVLILFAAAGLSFWFHAIPDGLIILFIIAFNAVVGFMQERRAGSAMDRLRSMAHQIALVVRDGEEREVNADDLVVGDIIRLDVGSMVPADGRVVEGMSLRLNEAVFTGEATPVETYERPLPATTDVFERHNLVWRGTTVVAGRGFVVITAVGASTRFGQIVREVSGEYQETPFQKRIAEFARRLAFVIIILSLGVFMLSVMRGIHVEQALLLGVSLVVSLIPEGLPVVITFTFAWGMWQMARRRALVRKLYAVETLGSVTVIATDKTGTLTFGEMMVERIVIGSRAINVTGEGYRKTGDFFEGNHRMAPAEDPVIRRLIEVSAINNDSRMTRDEKGRDVWFGDPTEICLIVLAEKAGFKHADLDLTFPRVGEFPFDFKRKYMVTFHITPTGKTLVAVKGAPRQILDLCTKVQVGNEVRPFSDGDRTAVREHFEHLARQSLRGLAVAYAEIDGSWSVVTHQNLHEHLIYVGLVGIRDTVRPEARETVTLARQAGVRVIMLTGDYHETAITVAKEVGILHHDEQEERVVDGRDLDGMTDDQLAYRLRIARVFSRVSPEQKLRIARTLKRSGDVVAMTGDGINDVPALTEADIGIAIGAGSTDAAREAAEMIVTDGNLVSVVAAIEEGRVIFRNIQRVVIFLLASNFSGLVLILLTMFLGFPLPLLPIHIMWLNVITDPFLGIALAREPKPPDIMKEHPRRRDTPVMSTAQWGRITLDGVVVGTATFAVFIIAMAQGRDAPQIYALTLTTMALGEWAVAYTSRSSRRSMFSRFFSNRLILPVTVVVIAMQLSILYSPSLSAAFHLAPFAWIDWLLAGLAAVAVIIAEEVRKMILRSRPRPVPT